MLSFRSLWTNCFLAYDENNIAYFFDCGGRNLKQVYEYIEEHKLNLKYIILTSWTWRSYRRIE